MSNRLKNQLRYFFCAVNLIWFSVQLMAQEIADKRRNPVLGTNEYVNPVIQGFLLDLSCVCGWINWRENSNTVTTISIGQVLVE